jgi:hypothetical protein
MAEIPADVVDWLRLVFADCNARVTSKITRNPNTPEESLDSAWIEHLDHLSAPIQLDSQWVVKIQTHFLGGMRHFHQWEIADIGVLVFLRLGPNERKQKVALLQSKRLYPINRPIEEAVIVDYEIGFARLADPESEMLSVGYSSEFQFSDESRYGALSPGSDQVDAISRYQQEIGIRVYSQFYNPWSVPFVQRIPLIGYEAPQGDPDLGVRIIPASVVHERLEELPDRTPALSTFSQVDPVPAFGWPLESFICDEILGCREGDQFDSINEQKMMRLFNRRSGPISAAIAVTIEAPDAIA